MHIRSTTLSKMIVPKDLSTGTFYNPYKAVALATSPLLGMVRFIRYPNDIDQRELEFEILYPMGSNIRFQRMALNQYARRPKTDANSTQR